MLPINRKLTLVNFNDRNTKPSYIVIHYVGAVSTAKNNANYFYSTYRGASANYFVDETSIWQVVDDLDSAWHCGTTGTYYHPTCRNSNSIGIEMCCKNNGSWYFEDATVNNTIELTKYLMDKYNIPVSNVIRHYDVTHKVCPEPYVRDTAAWNNFKSRLTTGGSSDITNNTDVGGTYTLVNACPVYMNSANAAKKQNSVGTYQAGSYYIYNESNGMVNVTKTKGVAGGWINPSDNKASSSSTGYKVGDTVTINGVYTSSSSTTKLTPAVKTGTITRIIEGAKNPYLLNSGNIGWTNDSCIVSGSTSGGSASISVGSKVTLSTSASTYATGETIPSKYKGKTYTVQQVGNGKVLLKELYSWVRTSDLVGGSSISGTIKVGSKVVVTNPVDVNGTHLSVSGTYDVIEVNGSRVVIGKGSAVTAAININNLKLA